jgi:hypothetical protein
MSTPMTVFYSDPVAVLRLVRYLPCFFDINVTTCMEIVRPPTSAFLDARRLLKVEDEWPFNLIRQGKYRMGWCEVRYCRAIAILNPDTPSDMRECLVMAEQEAVVLRGIHMTRAMQDEMLTRTFPPLPVLDDLLRKENACYQLRHIQNRERLHQIMDLREILHLMVDLPVKHLCTHVLRMSNHSLMEVRKTTDFAYRWPLLTMGGERSKEVARQREAALAELNPKSYKAKVLRDATRAANTLSAQPAPRRRRPAPKKKQAPEAEVQAVQQEVQADYSVQQQEVQQEEEIIEPLPPVEPLVDMMLQTMADMTNVTGMAGMEEFTSTHKYEGDIDDLHFFDNFEFSASQEEERQYWEALGTKDDDEL